MKFICPCCGYLTLEDNPKRPTFEICPVCFWENDPLQNIKPDYFGGANRVSLNMAKANYKRFAASEERLLGLVRKPREEEIQK